MLLNVDPALYFARLAGLEVPRSRKVRCPFHADGTPSLHVYADAQRGWFCYGCLRGGSVYDFGAQLWGLNTRGSDFVELRDRLLKALAH